MSWLAITAPFLVGLLVVFIPGLMVAAALKMRGIDAFGIAPALSIAMVAISAIVAPMMGVGWALWVPFAFAALIALLGFLIQRGADALGGRRRRSDRSVVYSDAKEEVASRAVNSSLSPLVESRWFSREQALYWVSFTIGAILLARNVTNAVGRPEWVSQTYDNNFHLNVIRFIAESGSASSMTVGEMTSAGNPPGFYPAAWHGVVSLMFMTTNASIPVATNAMVVLTGAIIWPLSVIFMLRNILKLNTPGILSVGALSAAFSAYPVLLINFGVLYPNLLGNAIIPAGIAVIAQMFRVSEKRRMTVVQTVFLGIFVALGIALAHPNAIMSLLVIVVPAFVTFALVQFTGALRHTVSWKNAIASTVGIAAILWLIYFLWGVVRPPKDAGIAWGPELSQAQAYGEAVLNATMNSKPQWMLFILLVLGLVAVFVRKNRTLWLVAAWAIAAFFYAAARSLPWDEDRYWVVGVWYHDSFRLAALLPVVTLPLAVLGVHWLTSRIADAAWYRSAIERVDARRIGSEAAASPARSGQAVLALCLSALTVASVGYFGQTSLPLKHLVESTFWLYAPDPESPLLSPDEIDVLDHVDEYVPDDSKILVQPFTGSALAYALAERDVSAKHVLWTRSADEEYVENHLNQALTDPKVCQILEKENYRYYLDFGKYEVLEGGDHSAWFPGYENLEKSGVVTPIYSKGPATLYEITACGK